MSAKNTTKELRARLGRVTRSMRAKEKNSALIVSSGTSKQRARDLNFPYHQDNDFFYLTDSSIEDTSLLVFGDARKPLLIAPVVTEHQIIWEGEPEDSKKLARRLGATLIQTKEPHVEIRKALSGITHIFHPNGEGQQGYQVARGLLALPSHRRTSSPFLLGHTDHVLEGLRLIKSPFEAKRIQSAVDITEKALNKVLPLIKPGMDELTLARKLRHAIEEQGSTESFPSIVASGPNAAVLHHSPSKRRFKDGELLVIDFGATYLGYASDITRVFQVGEKLSPKLRAVYELLLDTQIKVMKKIRPGKVWRALQEETQESLLKGLKDLGILKGTLAKLKKEKAIQKLYPHSLGHSLGIAVHDVGPLRSTGNAKLEPGMVITVEPGLYSRKRIGGLAPFGMRIEDDVLVTKTGAKVLSSRISKELR